MHLFPGILFSQLYSPSYVGLGITGCIHAGAVRSVGPQPETFRVRIADGSMNQVQIDIIKLKIG
jgi:hypothetical protein